MQTVVVEILRRYFLNSLDEPFSTADFTRERQNETRWLEGCGDH